MGIHTLIKGLAIGATVAYFFDPVRGRQRRAQLESHVGGFVTDLERGLKVAASEVQKRVEGVIAEAKSMCPNENVHNEGIAELKNIGREKIAGEEWSPGTKLLATAAGISFAVYMTRRPGLVLSLLGLASLARPFAAEGRNHENAESHDGESNRADEPLRADKTLAY